MINSGNNSTYEDMIEEFIKWRNDESNYVNDQMTFNKMLGDASEKQIYRMIKKRNYLCISPKSQKLIGDNSWVIIDFPNSICQSNEIFEDNLENKNNEIKSEREISLEVGYFLQENITNIAKICYKQGNLVVMQDLGNVSLFNLLNNHPIDQIKIGNCYEELIHWIAKLQQLGKKIPSNHFLKQRRFDTNIMKREFDEFLNYFPLLIQSQRLNDIVDIDKLKENEKKDEIDINELKKEIDTFYDTLIEPNESLVLIHRDFQSKNIMYVTNLEGKIENKPYVIDNQDICLGSMFYDLASLLYDVNAQMSSLERQRLAKIYWEHYQQQNYKYNIFIRKIRMIAIQRILKSIGRHAKIYHNTKRDISLQTIKKAIPTIHLLIQEIEKDDFELKFSKILIKYINMMYPK